MKLRSKRQVRREVEDEVSLKLELTETGASVGGHPNTQMAYH